MTIYIASSLKNWELNLRIETVLVSLGHRCFLPQRDAVQPKESDPIEKTQLTMIQNAEGIEHADAIILVGKNLGIDTAWEVGFAKALEKPVLMLCSADDRVKSHLMLWHSADVYIKTDSYRDLEDKLETGLAQFPSKASDHRLSR